jgi:hypothetical protein
MFIKKITYSYETILQYKYIQTQRLFFENKLNDLKVFMIYILNV